MPTSNLLLSLPYKINENQLALEAAIMALAAVRKQLYDLDLTARGNRRETDPLRGMLDGFIDRPKTII